MLFSATSRVAIDIITKRFASRKPKYYKSWPNDWVPFHWSRPEKIPGFYDSGDLVPLEEVPEEEIHPDFRKSGELKALDSCHPLRKMFSLSHTRKVQQSKIYAQNLIDQLGVIHHVDFPNSLEAKIISLTYSIRQVQAKVTSDGGGTRWNGRARALANDLKNRRYRYLCDLKEQHQERYEKIIKILNIEPKPNLINVPFKRPYRKIQMRTLAQDYSWELKEKKVTDFMESLEVEKTKFEQYKEDTLKWIEEKEAQIGMKV